MKSLPLILASILAMPALSDGEAPFEIDSEQILALFIAAVREQFPDISPQELKLAHGIWVNCLSTRPRERPALDEEFWPCIAGVNFELDPSLATSRYRSPEGDCKVRKDLESLWANLLADGSIAVRWLGGLETEDAMIKCKEDSEAPPKTSSPRIVDAPFSVDTKEILEIAVAAVTQAEPDIHRDHIFLDGVIMLTCDPVQIGRGIPGLHAKIAPCVALLKFALRPEANEYRFVDSNGKCKIISGAAFIEVHLEQNGGVRYSGRRGARSDDERIVECTEEFYELLRQDT